MVGVLIATGKRPSRTIRLIAQALRAAIPASRLEFRGQRSISSMVAKARKKGFSRFCVISKKGGKAAHLSFFTLSEKGWGRLSPQISVTSASFPSKPPKTQPQSLAISGGKAKKLASLINCAAPKDGGQEAKITALAGRISILIGSKRIATLGVKYEK